MSSESKTNKPGILPVPREWCTKEGRSPIAAFVNSVHPVSDALLNHIDALCFSHTIQKGKLLLKAGEICHHLYFIRKGVFRGFVKEGSKEITTWITAENEIIASIRGIEQQLPSVENIQAIEDSELVGGSFEQLQFLYDNYPEMNIVSRKLLTQYYADAEERAYICRLTNATSRYNHFMSTKGQLVNRIPLRFIASYLGMTLETLSRTRSKMR